MIAINFNGTILLYFRQRKVALTHDHSSTLDSKQTIAQGGIVKYYLALKLVPPPWLVYFPKRSRLVKKEVFALVGTFVPSLFCLFFFHTISPGDFGTAPLSKRKEEEEKGPHDHPLRCYSEKYS